MAIFLISIIPLLSLFIFYFPHKLFSLSGDITFIFDRIIFLPENIRKSKFFFEKEVTDKGNMNTKLVYSEELHPKTLIFGLVMSYPPERIRFFFDSLVCTKFNGTVMILYANLLPQTKNYIVFYSKYFKVILTPIAIEPNYFDPNYNIEIFKDSSIVEKISESKFQTVDFINVSFASGDFRFEIAYSLYLNHFFDNYDLVLLTDIGDVLFQLDISKFNYSEGVYICEESRISLKRVTGYMYTNKVLGWVSLFKLIDPTFLENSEICVGTLFLYGKQSYSFLSDLHFYLKRNLHLLVTQANFQGVLKYLVYNESNAYPEGYIHFITNEHGIVNTIAAVEKHIASFQKNYPNFINNIYDVIYHDQYYLFYNMDFQKQALIHHTKYSPLTEKLTYKGILSKCRIYTPDIHDSIVSIHQQLNIIF